MYEFSNSTLRKNKGQQSPSSGYENAVTTGKIGNYQSNLHHTAIRGAPLTFAFRKEKPKGS